MKGGNYWKEKRIPFKVEVAPIRSNLQEKFPYKIASNHIVCMQVVFNILIHDLGEEAKAKYTNYVKQCRGKLKVYFEEFNIILDTNKQ